ncbi:hypothetical protein ACFLXD_02040 [Chloroflexota bacterium]
MFTWYKLYVTMDFNYNDDDWYRFTEAGRGRCLKFINGQIPSELGVDFDRAFVIPSSCAVSLANRLAERELEREVYPEYRKAVIELVDSARELSKKYRDAAVLTKECSSNWNRNN